MLLLAMDDQTRTQRESFGMLDVKKRRNYAMLKNMPFFCFFNMRSSPEKQARAILIKPTSTLVFKNLCQYWS